LAPEALNEFEPNPMPVAVVAVNEAGTFKRALSPKIMPEGFIKYKLALLPVT
jgi:hypothetical protein